VPTGTPMPLAAAFSVLPDGVKGGRLWSAAPLVGFAGTGLFLGAVLVARLRSPVRSHETQQFLRSDEEPETLSTRGVSERLEQGVD